MALNPHRIQVSKVESALQKSTSAATLGAAFAAIRSDRWRASVRWVRDCIANNDTEAAREAKLALPAIMPSGLFFSARASAIQRYSGLICADLDDLEDIESTVEWLEACRQVCGWFRSPSGTGIKAFVATDAMESVDHWRAWCSVRALFADGGLTLDPQTADLPRLCFVSWDTAAMLRDADRLPLLPENQIAHKPAQVEKCGLIAPVDATATMRDAVTALDQHGPAIQGEAGDFHTMRACQIGHDYGIPAVDWLPVLEKWNKTCRPPWTAHALRSKLRSTYANSRRAFGSAGMFAGVFG